MSTEVNQIIQDLTAENARLRAELHERVAWWQRRNESQNDELTAAEAARDEAVKALTSLFKNGGIGVGGQGTIFIRDEQALVDELVQTGEALAGDCILHAEPCSMMVCRSSPISRSQDSALLASFSSRIGNGRTTCRT